jgi:hypothetical protein
MLSVLNLKLFLEYLPFYVQILNLDYFYKDFYEWKCEHSLLLSYLRASWYLQLIREACW